MNFKLSVTRLTAFSSSERDALEKLGIPKSLMWTEDVDVTIEVNTLEELLAFIGVWGKLVVTSDSIEIYNGRREYS